jgi:hypothetical protein
MREPLRVYVAYDVLVCTGNFSGLVAFNAKRLEKILGYFDWDSFEHKASSMPLPHALTSHDVIIVSNYIKVLAASYLYSYKFSSVLFVLLLNFHLRSPKFPDVP